MVCIICLHNWEFISETFRLLDLLPVQPDDLRQTFTPFLKTINHYLKSSRGVGFEPKFLKITNLNRVEVAMEGYSVAS